MITINVTYQTISQKSASMGDFEEHGFIVEDLEFSKKEDALSWFENNYGNYEKLNYNSFGTTDADRCLLSGNETYYTIHF